MISHGNNIKIFAGNASKTLARDICAELGLRLGDATVTKFSDGESSVSIYETVRGGDIFVVQSTCQYSDPEAEKETERVKSVNDSLMEMLVMIDALKRASAARITAVIPYFGYARQDRKAKARDPISAKLVANLLVSAGADRVLTMDLHASQIQGFFDIPVDVLAGTPIFAGYYIDKFGEGNEDVVAVSPDVGSVSRTRAFAERIGVNLAIVDKRRPKANQSEVMHIIGDVKDKTVILFDDMVDTAGSLCNAAKALMEIGGAKEIYACASHGVLSGPALDRLSSSVIKEVVFLNTIPEPYPNTCGKIKYLSVSKMFAEAIDRIFGDISISPLF